MEENTDKKTEMNKVAQEELVFIKSIFYGLVFGIWVMLVIAIIIM
jgi:hypothetical protein